MGNRSRTLVIALGIFFVGVAVLAKFYAYPTLAVAPADQVAHTVSTTQQDATVFVVATQKETQLPLTSTRTVRGDVVAAEKISEALDREVVVFDTAVVTDDDPQYQFPAEDDAKRDEKAPLSFVQERVVLDAHTGEAVRWNPDPAKDNSGEYITTTLNPNDRKRPGDPVFKGHEGLVLKFPFGTEKKTYQFWDSTLRKAFPIEFQEETELLGLKVYKFVQDVPKSEVPLVTPLKVPGAMVEATGQDAVEVQRSYQNIRTLWIEPVTGAIIKGEEKQFATIDYQGEAKITATEATIAYNDATVKKNVEGAQENGREEGGYQEKASQLHLIGFWVPLLSLIVGLLLLAAAAFFSLRPRTARRAAG
ncbi:hypothetical protein Kfla_3099 [Kribbella flavida DSM 17836]|uniref:DUF3068 domain-containing protein n=1 Tax=Kribbella flavida (strain DSM 17836 / JCM 10339 / NBRC 14399) TaxID=479435 RepID=D2Q338_KRIFD|nr:DUF3068 domain-containing protein [Kribbella flavida]ADB32163.1 hypothetical protein Kfla_3099 [Kribbella flavida DSM 17836]